jgi:hypothetical protein
MWSEDTSVKRRGDIKKYACGLKRLLVSTPSTQSVFKTHVLRYLLSESTCFQMRKEACFLKK